MHPKINTYWCLSVDYPEGYFLRVIIGHGIYLGDFELLHCYAHHLHDDYRECRDYYASWALL